MSDMKKHLDSEYRRRWIEFHMQDCSVEDSRQKNWRDVAWDKVEKIVVEMNGKRHVFGSDYPGFKFFMNFRWGGKIAQLDDAGQYIGHKPVHIWTVGYCDGTACFLNDIDFFTGDKVNEYSVPVSTFIKHVHDNVRHLVEV